MNSATSTWTYEKAFARNLGLISASEQAAIKDVRIAIAGMGGVGGVHLMTLVRMGFEKFNIADFDTFDVANFNRQYGASLSTLGQNKAEVMAKLARDINPNADIRVFTEPVTKESVPEFLRGCRVYVDGMDAFAIHIRRELFMQAHNTGMVSVTAGPIGFSVAYLAFSPTGMSFDKYFGYDASEPEMKLFARFIAGLSPRFLHLPYIDRSKVDFETQRGPSSALACQLCSGVMGAEVLKIVLGRGTVRYAPKYQQFDAYRGRFAKGRQWFGSRNPVFRLLTAFLYNSFQKSTSKVKATITDQTPERGE